MTLPLWRQKQLADREADRADQRATTIRNLFDFSSEFDDVDGVHVPKPVTSAFYGNDAIVCRDCRAHAGECAIAIVDHADTLCASCRRPLGEAHPLPQRARRER